LVLDEESSGDTSMNLLLPIIISLSGFLFVVLASKLFMQRFLLNKEKSNRNTAINRYIDLLPQNKRRQLTSLSNFNDAALYYGEKLVKDKYGGQLKSLLLRSGSEDSSTFTKLVQQKVFFSLTGILVSLFFLLTRNFTSLPIVLLIVLISYFQPNLQEYLLSRSKGTYGRGLTRLLNRSGNQSQEIKALYRKKLVSTVVSLLISYFYLLIKGGSVRYFLLLIISMPFGFFLPDILLVNRVEKRKELISEKLPEAIDLLSMCVTSGLAFSNALVKVSEMQKGPVSEEFMRVNTQVQIGQARSEALLEMAERTGSKPMLSFVNAVVQVDRYGIPISGALRSQAIEMRAERRALAREKGQKVPIKILGPIMICFLPCVVIIVLAPAIIGIISGLSSV
jgi:Flp pilus assembly protein TadB